jgi:translation initiation factor 5
MSRTINIAGLVPVDDPSYRYKMPTIIGKVEGRGNGIKTVLVNVSDVSTSLNRDAPELTKFFGCELGSQTTYAAETDRAVVNGAHGTPDLQALISIYIEKFVLCRECRLPETQYKIKGGVISQRCLACGAKEAVDMQHKLTTFILAQHKKAKIDADKDAKREAKKEKKEKKEKSETEDGEKKEKKEKKEKTEQKEKKEKKAKKEKANDTSDQDSVAEPDDAAEEDDDTNLKAAGKLLFRFFFFLSVLYLVHVWRD